MLKLKGVCLKWTQTASHLVCGQSFTGTGDGSGTRLSGWEYYWYHILSCVRTHECQFRIECYDKKRASECCTTVRLRWDQWWWRHNLIVNAALTSTHLGLLAWREPFILASWESTSWIRTTLAETCLANTGTCSDTWRLMTTGSTTGTGDPTLGLTGWWMQGSLKCTYKKEYILSENTHI